MGWLLCKKHPDVKKFGTRVSMTDLEQDALVMFQHKHYMNLMYACSILIPVAIPIICWNETFLASFFFAGVFRYIISLHITWLINSAAHSYVSIVLILKCQNDDFFYLFSFLISYDLLQFLHFVY